MKRSVFISRYIYIYRHMHDRTVSPFCLHCNKKSSLLFVPFDDVSTMIQNDSCYSVCLRTKKIMITNLTFIHLSANNHFITQLFIRAIFSKEKKVKNNNNMEMWNKNHANIKMLQLKRFAYILST